MNSEASETEIEWHHKGDLEDYPCHEHE